MRPGWAALLLLFLGMIASMAVPRSDAADIESALSPGKLVTGHAKFDTDCRECHAPFRKEAQSGLCRNCHKDVSLDITQGAGFHGRHRDKACRECHTEHKGRDMNIAPLDEKKFDHGLTDYPLKGAHADPKLECRTCHTAGRKFREAPSFCVSCHKKDDIHKGSLGKECAGCHVEKDWKTVRFDHDKTDFKLRGGHQDVACKDCHSDPRFKGAPTACVSCHRKVDESKGHKGRFGTKCESCHVDRDWKTIRFDHARDTKYPLRGAHMDTRCTACHTGILYKEKFRTECVACHRKDDDVKGHKGNFGPKCESCHVERDWKTIRFDHDRDTKYPLRGAHVKTACTACHTGMLYQQKLRTLCIACHEKDDEHRGQQGKRCENCHNERSWESTRFDHDLTRFPLLGKHADVKCKLCHLSARFKDVAFECASCHEKEDTHKGRLGNNCGLCHNARDWKTWTFDHDKLTHFPLEGGHKGLACQACHSRPVRGRPELDRTCVSCHDSDDVHDGGFGRQCERCHLTSSFGKLKPGMGGLRH